jgi:hypothetical protein
MKTFLLLLVHTCVSQYISVYDLRQRMISSNCCPMMTTYDPCCTLTINSTTYLSQHVRDHYSMSNCCGQGDTCIINLNECTTCTQICTSYITNYDPIVATLSTSFVTFGEAYFVKINLTISDSARYFSALQFTYTTNSPYHPELYSNVSQLEHVNNGVYVDASVKDEYFSIIHNPVRNIIVAVVEPHFNVTQAILFLTIPHNASQFQLSNMIVTNDQVPPLQYTIL